MNGTAALAEVVEIGDILSKGEEADWDVRTKVMVRLQELAPSAAKYESFANGLDKIKQHLVAQLSDLRSQVIKESCMTVGVLAQSLGSDFDGLVGHFFPSLLRLTGVKTLVMSQAAHDALLKVMEHVSPTAGVEVVLTQATTVKGPKERARCLEYLSLLLDRASTDSLERQRDSIASAIVAGMSDASPEARSLARGCFQQFAGHWNERAAALKETLDSSIQRALARDAQATASSSSSKKKPSAESSVAAKRRAAAAAKRDQSENLRGRVQQAQRISVQTVDAAPPDVVLEHRLPVRVPVPETKAAPAVRIPVEREEIAVVPLLAGAERIPAPTTPLPLGSSSHRQLAEHGSTRTHHGHAAELPSDEPASSASASKAKRIRLPRIPPHRAEATDSRSQPTQQSTSCVTPLARHATSARPLLGLSTPPAKRIAVLNTDWEAESGHLTAPIPMIHLMKAKQLNGEKELRSAMGPVFEDVRSDEPDLKISVAPPSPMVKLACSDSPCEPSHPVVQQQTTASPSIGDLMNVDDDGEAVLADTAPVENHHRAFDVTPYVEIFSATLDILVQLPAAAPLDQAVCQARACLAESAQDCIERVLACIVIASRHGRLLAARRALEACVPLILSQPNSLARLAQAAVRLLMLDEADRQHVFLVMHQVLMLLPPGGGALELDDSLRSFISPVLLGMDDTRVEVRKAATDVAAVLWVKLDDAVLPLFSRLTPLASRMLAQRRDQAQTAMVLSFSRDNVVVGGPVASASC